MKGKRLINIGSFFPLLHGPSLLPAFNHLLGEEWGRGEKGIVDYALSFPFPSLATGTQPRPEGVTRLLLENLWQKKGKKVAVQLLLIDYPGNSRGSEESRPTSVSFRNQLRAVL